MTQRTNLFVVDADFRHRAAISHSLAGTEIHAEPFEDLEELARRWPRDGLILVHDEGVMVRRTIDLMTEVGRPFSWAQHRHSWRRRLRPRLDNARSYSAFGSSRSSLATTPICQGMTR